MTKSPVSQPIETRPFRSDDYAAGRELWRELTQHHRTIYDDSGIGGDNPGAGFDAYLANPKRAGSWVATHSSAVLGLAGILSFNDDGFEVEPVIVSAAARGRGVGQRLIEKVFAEARDRGLNRISVRPVARNAEAMAFYHHVGFRTLGFIELMAFLDDSRTTWIQGVEIHGDIYSY